MLGKVLASVGIIGVFATMIGWYGHPAKMVMGMAAFATICIIGICNDNEKGLRHL